MSKCGWCGKVITGEPVLTIGIVPFISDSESEDVLMPGHIVDFCCHGCAWAFSVETHRLMGLSGKDLRTHLIAVHGFSHPPGKPAGGMRRDCLIIGMAKSLASVCF